MCRKRRQGSGLGTHSAGRTHQPSAHGGFRTRSNSAGGHTSITGHPRREGHPGHEGHQGHQATGPPGRAARRQVRERAVGGMATGSRLSPSRYLSTAAAADRPSAMAQTISD